MRASIWKEDVKRLEPGSAWAIGQEATGKNGTQEVSPEYELELLYYASDWVLEKVAQRCCGFSFYGDIEKLSGHNFVQGTLGVPAWEGLLD